MTVRKVRYTVKEEFVETNKANIAAVMAYLSENPIEGMWYRAFLLEDGVTFVHINICDNDAVIEQFTQCDAFVTFRDQLKASKPVHPPKQEIGEMVA